MDAQYPSSHMWRIAAVLSVFYGLFFAMYAMYRVKVLCKN